MPSADAKSSSIRARIAPVQQNIIAACWSALRVSATVLHGWTQIVLIFPWITKAQRDVRVQNWARTVLKRLNVELIVVGTPPRVGPLLMVSNHISWLDIVALHAVCHCRFVSKADVRRWPLIGTLAAGGGTLFVERESRRDAMRIVHAMADALRDGDILAVFPEGTTGDGTAVLPFHSNLIQAAISADAPVQPVAIQFVHGRSGRRSRDVSYMGDESLVGSIWRTACVRDLSAVIVFGAPQRADGRDRRAWAHELHREIAAMRQF